MPGIVIDQVDTRDLLPRCHRRRHRLLFRDTEMSMTRCQRDQLLRLMVIDMRTHVRCPVVMITQRVCGCFCYSISGLEFTFFPFSGDYGRDRVPTGPAALTDPLLRCDADYRRREVLPDRPRDARPYDAR